ncbi:26S proteasome non-ATPase regulatory subunit 10 [Fistulifera solaris]|uniref:26S proteasome non-ATPase regulatory subunit 10 n=1 Tax=Fistulifera solaris TaxID=1519565 RepID=A0A1Z5KTF5_FISSO|nr:26S proteasome non-ATPase regulatory subunit 10 [Fistulifera solaris]|eukprot:GAX29271.1 26S proteasome non-ATPase regulatory subunit 10 [Fistulifera solaris]
MDLLFFEQFRYLQLNQAAADGDLPFVEQLASYADNRTLLIACQRGHAEIVHFLLMNCSQLDVEAGDPVHDRSPLGWACQKGHLEVARLLIEKYKCSLERTDEDGSTALHLACSGGHLDVARLLVQNSAHVDCRDHVGATPLYLASDAGYGDMVRFLLDDALASIDVSDDFGWTPLFLSVMNAQRSVCGNGVLHILLERGGDIHAATFTGDTPMKRAVVSGLLDPLYGILRTRPEEWETWHRG